MMTTASPGPDIDLMIAELRGAGWTPVTLIRGAIPKCSEIWRSPNAKLFLGPDWAWRWMKGVGSATSHRDSAVARQQIINRALKLRVAIQQIFTDCASWNDNARKASEEPIDPDPDGQLRRIADGLDASLTAEHAGTPLPVPGVEGNTEDSDGE